MKNTFYLGSTIKMTFQFFNQIKKYQYIDVYSKQLLPDLSLIIKYIYCVNNIVFILIFYTLV